MSPKFTELVPVSRPFITSDVSLDPSDRDLKDIVTKSFSVVFGLYILGRRT